MKNIAAGLFTGLCMFISVSGHTQSTTTTPELSNPPAQNTALNYVRLDIGMHILDCPVLPPQLKSKLMTIKGIKDYTVDMKTESILFNVPEGAVTKEQIEAMAARSGFPAGTVIVKIDNKPFATK